MDRGAGPGPGPRKEDPGCPHHPPSTQTMSPGAPWLSLTHSLWALSMETRGLSEPPAHKADEWPLAAHQTIPRLWGGEIRQGHRPSQSQWLRIHEHTASTLQYWVISNSDSWEMCPQGREGVRWEPRAGVGEPTPPALQGRFLTPRPAGRSQTFHSFMPICLHSILFPSQPAAGDFY